MHFIFVSNMLKSGLFNNLMSDDLDLQIKQPSMIKPY